MVSLNDVRERKSDIFELAEKRGISDIRVFGSFARGTASERSDLDLLVKVDSNRSLLDRIGFMNDLQDLLHVKVDVVNENALNNLIRESILKEGIPL